jgi:hypothetical protein
MRCRSRHRAPLERGREEYDESRAKMSRKKRSGENCVADYFWEKVWDKGKGQGNRGSYYKTSSFTGTHFFVKKRRSDGRPRN